MNKPAQWLLITVITLIAIVVCLGFVFVVCCPNRNLSVINVEKEITSHAIQDPFIATLGNTFGIVSSEPGLPYYPLYRVSGVSKLHATSIHALTGIYFRIVNAFEDKHHKYSSVWFYSYKEKKLYRLLETREKEYWIDSFRFNPDILVLKYEKGTNETINVLFDVSKKEFIPIPTELSNKPPTVTFTSVPTLAILSQYDATTELYTYHSWDFQQNTFTKIGEGNKDLENITNDGSFFVFNNPMQHCTYAFNCQTGETFEIPWINKLMKWSLWPETKRLFCCYGMDTWYNDLQNISGRPYIEILQLENMKKDKIEFPIRNGELYQEKLVFHDHLIFGVIHGDSEELLALDSTYTWNHFYTLQSLLLVNDQFYPSYWYKSVNKPILRTITQEKESYPLTFKLSYENCVEEETRLNTLLFDHNFQCIKELTKKESVEPMFQGSWLITTKIGRISCETVWCRLEQDTVYEFFVPDPGTTYRFTKKEIEKSLAEEGFDKPYIYDEFLYDLFSQRKYAVYECSILENIEKNGLNGTLSKKLFFILSFEDSKIYSNGTKPNLEFACWIDHE
jgi:hypothetical protein